jgi:hypothetical protein
MKEQLKQELMQETLGPFIKRMDSIAVKLGPLLELLQAENTRTRMFQVTPDKGQTFPLQGWERTAYIDNTRNANDIYIVLDGMYRVAAAGGATVNINVEGNKELTVISVDAVLKPADKNVVVKTINKSMLTVL